MFIDSVEDNLINTFADNYEEIKEYANGLPSAKRIQDTINRFENHHKQRRGRALTNTQRHVIKDIIDEIFKLFLPDNVN